MMYRLLTRSIFLRWLNIFSRQFIALLLMLALALLVGCDNDDGMQTQPSSDSMVTEPASAEELADEVAVEEEPPLVAEAPTREASDEAVVGQTGMGNANVLFVEAKLADDGTWTFIVTVEHNDTGWEDYADGWDVLLPDGTIVKPEQDSPFTRLLLHPHVSEQPFSRSQRGIIIPPSIEDVTVRAHDLVDGYGGQEITISLVSDSGPGFKVIR